MHWANIARAYGRKYAQVLRQNAGLNLKLRYVVLDPIIDAIGRCYRN